MSEVYSGAPRPRVLVHGLTEAEIEIVRPLAGSLRVTASIYDVHAEEYDVLIETGADFNDSEYGFSRRLVFAPKPEPRSAQGGRRVSSSSGSGGLFAPTPTTSQTRYKPARDFKIMEFSRDQGIEQLVRRSCIPEADTIYAGFHMPVWPERETYALLQERLSNPLILAALLERVGAPSEQDSALWLPDAARFALKDWILFAFAHWRSSEPTIFPVTAEWKSSDDWAALGEIEARKTLSEFDDAAAIRREQAERERIRLVDAVEIAELEGVSWRALVSETGDELVVAVKEALEFLGFMVLDSDSMPQHKGKKREDLRVSDGSWVALLEVKGYSRAAKSNDLLQLMSASNIYAAEVGQVLDALWYVPNVYREVDPAQREIALAGREEDLVSFGENFHGCLLDTRDLFTLRQSVVTGRTSVSDAREILKNAVSRFQPRHEEM